MANCIGATDHNGTPGQWNAREIARRHQAQGGRPLSPMMKTVATACELAHSPAARASHK